VSLLARYLESNGMPTVIMGSALDIVQHCGAARFFFVDFPLGNPCGKPWDRTMQDHLVSAAVELFEAADQSSTTVYAREDWGDVGWKQRYMAVDDSNRAELAIKGAALRRNRHDRQKRIL